MVVGSRRYFVLIRHNQPLTSSTLPFPPPRSWHFQYEVSTRAVYLVTTLQPCCESCVTQTSIDTLQHRSQPDCRPRLWSIRDQGLTFFDLSPTSLCCSCLFFPLPIPVPSKCGAIHHIYKNVWFLLDLYYCFPHSSQPVLLVSPFQPYYIPLPFR
jgi:hypothetical protein